MRARAASRDLPLELRDAVVSAAAAGKLVEFVGEGGEAEDARAALTRAFAREVARHPRDFCDTARGARERDDHTRAERAAARAQRFGGEIGRASCRERV